MDPQPITVISFVGHFSSSFCDVIFYFALHLCNDERVSFLKIAAFRWAGVRIYPSAGIYFSFRFVLSCFFFCLPSPFLLFSQHHSLLYILRYISSLGRNRRSTEPCRITLCRCTEFNTNNQDSPLFPAPTSTHSCFRFRLLLYHSVCSTERIFFFFCFLSIGAELIPLLCVSPPCQIPHLHVPFILLDFTHMHFRSC